MATRLTSFGNLTTKDYQKRIASLMDEAEKKAWNALSRYKFNMFGYWAAVWVHWARIQGGHRPNPFRGVVKFARESRHG